MDHFILPPGAQHYITVPYKCVEPYDNGDFYTYPERKGWTSDDLEGKNEFGHRRPKDIETFFQSWLFFGVLVEVFKIVDIRININDFIDRKKGLVTTRKLTELMEEYATAWKKKWPKKKSLNLGYELQSTPKALATTKILKTVFHTMHPFCHNTAVEGRTSVPSTLMSPEIVVSIIGLATTFFEAGKFLYLEFGHDISRGGTPLLRSILEKKWCPFYVTIMQMQLQLDAQYYFAALPGLPKHEFQRHVDCTDIRCIEKPVDEATYVLRHAVAGCSCQPMSIPIRDLLNTIKQGDTPVVFFHKGDNGGNPYLEVKGFNTNIASSIPYISISHVWSDGMGNPNRNALPTCLLESIQSMVNAVDFPDRESDHNHVGFWMDTLCIPVEPQYEDHRKATIIKMRQIYQEASTTLAIESQLQTVPSTVSLIERCVYFYATKWGRRLWTYQEGGLPKHLYFQFRDKSMELRDIYETPDLHAPEHRGESMITQTRQSLARHFIEEISNQFGFIKGALDRHVGEGTVDSARWFTFLPIVGSYSPRMTTRKSDESLCLASVLHLDTTPLVKVKGPDGLKSDNKEIRKCADQELADERMTVLYCLIGTIQVFIIFNRYPRLPIEGFRWAPRTFLGQLPWPLPGEIESSQQGFNDGHASITKDGLPVKFPSIEFDYHPDLDATVGENFLVVARVGTSSGDFATSGDDEEEDDEDDGDNEDDEDEDEENEENEDSDDGEDDDGEDDEDEDEASDNSGTPGDDNEDIIGQGRYLVEPVNLDNDPPGFTWTVDASYRLVLQILPEDMVVGKSTIAVLGRVLPQKRTNPCIRHERLVRVTLVLPEDGSGSGNTSIPKVEGTEVTGHSMVIV